MKLLKLCSIITLVVSSIFLGINLACYLYFLPNPGAFPATVSMAVFGFAIIVLGFFLLRDNWALKKR